MSACRRKNASRCRYANDKTGRPRDPSNPGRKSSAIGAAHCQGCHGVGRTRDNIRLPSAVFADLDKSAPIPDHAWTASPYSVLVGAYNTKLVAVADVPKRYSDLLDSMWRGKLGIEAHDAHWFAIIVTALGEHVGIRSVQSDRFTQRRVHAQVPGRPRGARSCRDQSPAWRIARRSERRVR
jgi:hypothetical protein